MKSEKLPTSGLVALFLGAVALGFGPIFVRWGEVGPAATAFWRLSLPLPILWVWMLWGKPSPTRQKEKESLPWGLLTVGGICFALDLTVWHISIKLTSVANATLETNLSAVFIPLFAWGLFRQRVTSIFIAALLIAMLGTFMMVGGNIHFTSTTLQGDGWGILSGAFYAGYILALKGARDQGARTASVMLISSVVSALVLLFIIAISRETFLPRTLSGWAAAVNLAMVAQLIGQSLVTYALVTLPASFAGVGLLVEPATAAVAAWWLLNENLTGLQLTGGIVLVIGIWLAQRQSKNTKLRPIAVASLQ